MKYIAIPRVITFVCNPRDGRFTVKLAERFAEHLRGVGQSAFLKDFGRGSVPSETGFEMGSRFGFRECMSAMGCGLL